MVHGITTRQLDAGEILFGVDVERDGQGLGLLAVGVMGTRLLKVRVDQLRSLPEPPVEAVDRWVTSLSRAVSRLIVPTPRADLVLEPNNAICAEFAPRVAWLQADSSTYLPDGEFDLIFTCPPYYKVEKYLDYDGKPPPGEINSTPTYEEFRELLFSGYRQAISRLRDNRFFIVMTGDRRDKDGAYYCSEAETELFMKQQGLSVYNRIVYLECEFTRLAHAKRTLNTRKFPKREQKIIVAYKGDISAIPRHFAPVGRL